jgi:hypothetical protein
MRVYVSFLALLAATFLCGRCFEVTHPLTNSVVPTDGENAVEILYRFLFDPAYTLTVKVDVFGYADPEGWPSHTFGLHKLSPGGWVTGSLRVFNLEPGAVRIRLRAMTEEGSDVVSEVSLDYFLQNEETTTGEALANYWLKQTAQHEEASKGESYPRVRRTLMHTGNVSW